MGARVSPALKTLQQYRSQLLVKTLEMLKARLDGKTKPYGTNHHLRHEQEGALDAGI